MKKYFCPSCGAEVKFESSISVFLVCRYCRSTLVRKDLNLEALGKMAELKDDATPLQIGTLGHFKSAFVLIGRVSVSWDEGFWNEWYVRFSDGREAWLSEAQGLYMMSLRVENAIQAPKVNEIKLDSSIQIGKILYTVDDIKNVTYSFAEGELPFVAEQGFKGVSVDLLHGEDDFASISYGKNEDIDVFVGQYIEFEQFHFQNLRKIDGW